MNIKLNGARIGDGESGSGQSSCGLNSRLETLLFVIDYGKHAVGKESTMNGATSLMDMALIGNGTASVEKRCQ